MVPVADTAGKSASNQSCPIRVRPCGSFDEGEAEMKTTWFIPICSLFAACIGSAQANIIDDTYGVGAGSFELGNFVNGGGIP